MLSSGLEALSQGRHTPKPFAGRLAWPRPAPLLPHSVVIELYYLGLSLLGPEQECPALAPSTHLGLGRSPYLSEDRARQGLHGAEGAQQGRFQVSLVTALGNRAIVEIGTTYCEDNCAIGTPGAPITSVLQGLGRVGSQVSGFAGPTWASGGGLLPGCLEKEVV